MAPIPDPEIFPVQLVGLRDDNRWINHMIEIKAALPPLSHITSEFVPASDILTGYFIINKVFASLSLTRAAGASCKHTITG